MSYLVMLEGIPNFTQAVISLWFRVPETSVAAAAAEEIPLAPTYVLPHTIPLITFGVPQLMRRYEPNVENVSHYHFVPVNPITGAAIPPPPVFDSPTFNAVADDPVNPSYIGLQCSSDGMRLSVNIQMADTAALSALQFNIRRVDVYDDNDPPDDYPGLPVPPGSGWGGVSEIPPVHFSSLVDNSSVLSAQPEFFLVEPPLILAAEQWHHLLLSFDVGTPVITHGPPQTLSPFGSTYATTAEGTNSFCRFWYAIDDVNYRGGGDDPFFVNLAPYGVDGGSDPNAILTQTAYSVANSRTGLPANVATAPASYSYSPSAIPSLGGVGLGIPASSAYVDHIRPVEMAELQIFTGLTLDPAIDDNRRAFIDETGKPVPPAAAETLLGKKPEILLHGSGNWIAGRNTGSLTRIDPDTGLPLPGTPRFIPTGKTIGYSPGPSLHGPQGTSPAPALASAA